MISKDNTYTYASGKSRRELYSFMILKNKIYQDHENSSNVLIFK